VLGAVFLLSLIFRILLLDQRWVNPDEGAHLMDAYLLLRGYIPHVDFGARQPFYVLVNAIWIKIFGVNHLAGRLLPMTCSLLTAGLVLLIARKLFNATIAFLAAVIYLMMPLEVFNSVIVKTEPLATLLACASIFLLLKHYDDQNKFLLFISAALAALAYYVRESALVLPLVAFFFIVASGRYSLLETARSLLAYSAGYCLVIVVFFAYYAQFMSFEQLVFGRLDPLGFILNAGRKIWYLVLNKVATGSVDNIKAVIGTRSPYRFHYFKMTLFLHAFLLLGVGWAMIRAFLLSGDGRRSEILPQKSYLFSLLWLGVLMAAYVYYYRVSGYYIDYFREFLPVTSILFAAYLWEAIFRKESQERIAVSTALGVFGLTALFIVENLLVDIPKGIQIVCVIGVVAIIMLLRAELNKRQKISAGLLITILALFYLFSRAVGLSPRNVILAIVVGGMLGTAILFAPNRLRFINISLVLTLLILNITYAGNIMGIRYDSVWSNAAVREITNVIRENSSPDDKVLSGGVIWEFNSHRLPFEMISHPLAFNPKMPPRVAARIERGFKEAPPKIIVLDGYTEKTHVQHLQWMPEVLQRKYRLILEENRAKYPLRVYKLWEGD